MIDNLSEIKILILNMLKLLQILGFLRFPDKRQPCTIKLNLSFQKRIINQFTLKKI